jgi:hypothetical protein
MSFDLMFQTIDEMIAAVTIAVPKVVVAIVVFFAFIIVGRGIQWTSRRAIWRQRRRHNLGLVVGRLAHWAVVLVGLFVALSIVLPTLRAGDLIQLLGIGGSR